MIQISVVVCTYNRAEMLTGALNSLIQQSLGSQDYEIIVVNNGSTDNTPEVINTFQKNHPKYTILSLYEPQPGLGYARNTGWKHAQGKYVAYLDDDAYANINWLKNGLELFETVEPAPICVGGPIFPFYEGSKPAWFKDEYELRDWGKKSRRLERNETFSGSNMIWQRTILEAYDGFEVTVGVKGDILSLGEEATLFRRLWQSFQEPALFFSPKLIVHHLVSPQKMTVSYQLKRKFVTGQLIARRDNCKRIDQRVALFIHALGGTFMRSIMAVVYVRKHQYWQNWLVEDWAAVVRNLGILLSLLGMSISVKQR